MQGWKLKCSEDAGLNLAGRILFRLVTVFFRESRIGDSGKKEESDQMSDKSQETLLDELLQLETEKERRAYLDRVCQGDGDLRQRLTEKTLFSKFSQMIGTPAYMSPEQAEMTSLDVDT